MYANAETSGEPSSAGIGPRVRSFVARLAIIRTGPVAAELAAPFEHPRFHKVTVKPSALAMLNDKERTAQLTDVVQARLAQLGIDESGAVFRGLAHPVGNITPRLVCKYGTDRFVGYGRGDLPRSTENLTPYRNKGETDPLTADTYAVPALKWAIGGFTDLVGTNCLESFAAGRSEAFLLAYDSSKFFTERTPGDLGGEQWRGTFIDEPSSALLACMQFVPDESVSPQR